MSSLQQIGAVTAMNLRNIPRRLGTSMVIVIGIAGVVAVLVSVLAMSTGFIKTMRGAGRDDRAMVLRTGAVAETSSSIPRDAVDIIADTPGIKRDADGNPIYSAEFISLLLLKNDNGTQASVPLRGVGTSAFALRPEVKIVSGRMFEPTLNEVIVGKGALAQHRNLAIGSEIRGRSTVWKVVGIFESHGDMHESEMLTNNVILQSALKRVGISQVVIVLLESPAAFGKFKDTLTSNPSLSVDVINEREYFAEQSQSVASVLKVVALFVGSIMACGAIFGALNVMYSAVSTRTVEIATLRAIGFGAGPIVTSVMIEALLLSLGGGIIGAFLGWLFFNGHSVTTSAVGGGAALQSRVFSMYVSPALIVTGIVWASLIGFFAGLFPAIHAARLPIATALRKV